MRSRASLRLILLISSALAASGRFILRLCFLKLASDRTDWEGAMTMEEALVRVWRGALVEGAEEVELDGQRFAVRETPRKRLREVDFVFEGQKLRRLEQNPKTESRWAQLARAGHKVMQFLSAGRYIGNVVDGKVTIYGGKKKGGTIMRAPGALAELPKDVAQEERKKDKPQKRKRL